MRLRSDRLGSAKVEKENSSFARSARVTWPRSRCEYLPVMLFSCIARSSTRARFFLPSAVSSLLLMPPVNVAAHFVDCAHFLSSMSASSVSHVASYSVSTNPVGVRHLRVGSV